MSKVGKGIKRILAATLAVTLVLSPALSRTVQAVTKDYTAWSDLRADSPDTQIGIFVKEKTQADEEAVITYCMNHEKETPGGKDAKDVPGYWKEEATAASIDGLVGGDKRLLSGEALRRKTIAILRYGYGGENEVYANAAGLTDLRLRWGITQLAIWHFTDNYSGSFEGYLLNRTPYLSGSVTGQAILTILATEDPEEEAALIAALDDPEGKIAALIGQLKAARVAYDNLITADLTAEEAAKYVLDIYVTNDEESNKNRQFQNLAGFRLIEERDPKEILLSKQEAGGGSELAGAEMHLYLVDPLKGEIEVDSWTSGTEVHKFNVYPGASYKLTETQAPENYVTPDPLSTEWIVFTVGEDGTATLTAGSGIGAADGAKIVMYNNKKPNTPVSFSKTALGQDNELPGARIEVWKTDEAGNTTTKFAEWTSTTEPHVINEVYEGYYLMREIRSPQGYELAEDIRFRVNADKTIELFDAGTWTTTDHLLMEDADSPSAKVSFMKVSAETKEALAGAVMQVTHNGTVVQTWTSGANAQTLSFKEFFVDENTDRADDTEYTEYVFSEVSAPAGYEKSNETITFRIYRLADGSAVLRTADANGNWVDAADTLVLTIENKKLPDPPRRTTPDPDPTPTPTDPTPTPTPPGPTPTDPGTPVTPNPAPENPQVLGEQRPTDGQQAVLGARRAEAQTSDHAPVRILMIVMAIAGAGLVTALTQWTKPVKARRCPKNRTQKTVRGKSHTRNR